MNAFGFIFLTFAIIILNFPSEGPVTSQSMNYTSAAIGVIGVLAVITWFTTAYKQFTGPSGVKSVVYDSTSVAPAQEMEEEAQDGLFKSSK